MRVISCLGAARPAKLGRVDGTGRLAATIEKYTDDVNSVSFSPDGKRIVSSSGGKIILVHAIDW